MQAIGYRHIQPVVDGADTLVNALASMKVDTRRFARRQRTWLRAIPEPSSWLEPEHRSTRLFASVEGFLRACRVQTGQPSDGDGEGASHTPALQADDGLSGSAILHHDGNDPDRIPDGRTRRPTERRQVDALQPLCRLSPGARRGSARA